MNDFFGIFVVAAVNIDQAEEPCRTFAYFRIICLYNFFKYSIAESLLPIAMRISPISIDNAGVGLCSVAKANASLFPRFCLRACVKSNATH